MTASKTLSSDDDEDGDIDDVYSDDGGDDSDAFAEQRYANRATSKSQLL